MAVTIRRAGLKDASAYARIMGDPAVYPNLLQLPYADEETWRAKLAETSAPGKLDLLLVAERFSFSDGTGEPEVIGTAGLHPVGPALRRRHVMMLGISVVPTQQRQGVGHALMTAMVDYADRWAQVLRLELTVFTDNAPAIALYQRFGFQIEGTQRASALRDGVYADVHAMARLHPRPPRIDGGMTP